MSEFTTPWAPDVFTVKNVWQGYDEQGDFVQAYAGAPADDLNAGNLAIITTTSAGDTSEASYPTPQHDGPIEITSASGLLLTLTATDGTQFVFDVSTRQYTP